MQMALMDGSGRASLPNSTQNPADSPDGIFGEETRQAVKQFQRDSRSLVDDGIVGQKTLRELDSRFARFQHRVRLHFRSLALTQVPFQRSLTNAEIVFAQYGIRIAFASGESIGLTPGQRELFNPIDQACKWELGRASCRERVCQYV